MPILVTCSCGKAYMFKDEFAGRRAKCPACGQMVQIPGQRVVGVPTSKPTGQEALLPEEKRESRTLLYVGLGATALIVVVGLGIATYFFVRATASVPQAKSDTPVVETAVLKDGGAQKHTATKDSGKGDKPGPGVAPTPVPGTASIPQNSKPETSVRAPAISGSATASSGGLVALETLMKIADKPIEVVDASFQMDLAKQREAFTKVQNTVQTIGDLNGVLQGPLHLTEAYARFRSPLPRDQLEKAIGFKPSSERETDVSSMGGNVVKEIQYPGVIFGLDEAGKALVLRAVAGSAVDRLLAKIKDPYNGFFSLQPVQITPGVGNDFAARLAAVSWLTAAKMRLEGLVAEVQGQHQEKAAVKALLDLLQNENSNEKDHKAICFLAVNALHQLGPTCPEALQSLRGLQEHADPVISSQAKLHLAFAQNQNSRPSFEKAAPAPGHVFGTSPSVSATPSTISLPAPVVPPMPGQSPKPTAPQQSKQQGSTMVLPASVATTATSTKDTQAPVEKQDLARDLNVVMKNASDSRAKDHATKLGVSGTNLEVFTFLAKCGKFFIYDDQGNFNANANQDAFAAAVLSITPEMIQQTRALAKGTEGDSERGTIYILLSAGGTYVQQPGKFYTAGFKQAFQNLDASKIDKASGCLTTDRAVTLTLLLRLSGNFLNSNATFDAVRFNSRLDALKPSEFSGDLDQREKTFRERMKASTQ